MLSRTIRTNVSALLLLAVMAAPVAAAAPGGAGAGSPDSFAGERPPATAMGPARKVALGVSMLAEGDELAQYVAYKTDVGRAPAMWSIWRSWGHPENNTFPTGPLMAALKADGTVPVIIWQPDGPDNNDGRWSRYNRITGYTGPGGTYHAPVFDVYIKQFARDARDYGSPVLLRFAHEMDGTWFPWGIDVFDNTEANFVKAWKKIWKLFKNVGALANVRFFWSPLSPSVSENIYPGNQYVSYMGFSAFNWGDAPHGGWISMIDAFKSRYSKAKKVSTKPIIVAETGSAPGATSTIKDKWIKTGYPAVYNQMPQIKGIIYFNVNMTPIEPDQPDWRITPSPRKGYAGWKVIVEDARFKGTIT